MAAESNVNKWQNLLNCVIFSKSLPDFWDPCVDRVTYGLINELFDFIDQNNLSSSVIKPSISLLCGIDDASDIIKNVFSLKTSVTNLLKKKNHKKLIKSIPNYILVLLLKMIILLERTVVCLALI